MTPSRRTAVALLVAACFFMENLDGTIVTTAAPAIAADLGVNAAAIAITVTAFLLAVAVVIPASGWLTDRLGVRRVFLAAIALFTIASVLCAVSLSLPMLVAMRVLQGVGGALMVPVGRLAVLRVTPKSEIIRAIAILVWPGLVAPVIAPFLGGVLTTYASWHWIFLVNVPFGLVAFGFALFLVTDVELPAASRFDWYGLVATVVGLGALLWAAGTVTESGADVPVLIVVTAIGVVATALAIRHLLRTPFPLVDLRAFRHESFRVANASGSLYRATISAVPFLLPLLFQDAFGWSAVASGAIVLTLFIGNAAIKPATTRMLHGFGFRSVLVVSIVVGIACMVAMAFLTAAVPIALIVVLLVISGAARSVGFTVYTTITFADISAGEMTSANTLNSTLQQLSSGVGVAVGGLSLAVGQVWGPGAVPYRFAFLVIAALTLVPLVEAARMSRDAGSSLTRRA
ncbi:MAG: DHA2 family efflux MFS transporter permease subunit [Microbacterium sp.]|uniref:DHA2 family efflux MFS transporter permease subunit n=1 Tax=Microbacterium sp. TaxID=51671 RepID=UPI0039E49078